MIKNLFIILLFVMVWPALLNATPALRLFYLPTQQMLPVAQIHDIIQDDEGYMWYATPGGLCRDNGYQIDVFRPGQNDGGCLRNANIRCLRSMDNRIIFGTDSGMYVLDKRDYTFRSVALGTKGERQTDALLIAHDGTVWVSVGHWMVHLDHQLRALCRLRDSHAGMSLYEDSRHRIFHLQWQGGLSVLYPGAHSLRSLSWQGSYPTFMTEADRKTGDYWIGTFGNGIVRYHLSDGKLTPQAATLVGDDDSRQVINLLADNHQGLIWATTMNSLDAYRSINGSLQRVVNSWTLPEGHLIIDRLFQDRTGNLWVSGFSPQTFILAPDVAAVQRDAVEAMHRVTGFKLLPDRMVRDDDGAYWIWQGRYGLALYQPGRAIKFLSRQSGLKWVERTLAKSRSTTGIFAAAGDTYYYIHHQGDAILSKPLGKLPHDEVTALGEDNLGRLWVAGRKGISQYALMGACQHMVWQHTLSYPAVMAVGTDACFVSAPDGVWRIDGNGHATRCCKGDNAITSLAVAPDGTPWAGTTDGKVLHITGGQALVEKVKSSESHNAVKQVAFDRVGHLWVLFDQKVCQYDMYNNARQTWTADNADVQVDYFFALEPLHDGMGVGGAGAYCIFPLLGDLSPHDFSTAQPKVSTLTTADGKVMFLSDRNDEAELPSKQSTLILALCTGEHLHSANVTFAYKLDNGEWITLEQGQNQVYLYNLPSGRHQLFVKATDRFGNWGQPRMCLTITRLVPWYLSWWACLLYIFMAAAALWLLKQLNQRLRYLGRLQYLRREVSLKQISLEPADISSKRYDTELMRRLLAAIEQHLGEVDFNVVQLSEAVGMSRVNVYRKTKELTGKNPTDLIKEVRLKHAAELLRQENNATVADIASKVGFATPSYFSRCFKDMFGVLPNQYRHKSGEQ